jgi:hypothetical protein
MMHQASGGPGEGLGLAIVFSVILWLVIGMARE